MLGVNITFLLLGVMIGMLIEMIILYFSRY